MKTKINFQKQHLPIYFDLSSCQCIAKVKEAPFKGASLPRSIHAKSPYSIHFNDYITENCSVWYKCRMAARFKALILVTSTFVRKRSNPDFGKRFFYLFFFFFPSSSFFFFKCQNRGCGLYGAVALSPANTVYVHEMKNVCCVFRQKVI